MIKNLLLSVVLASFGLNSIALREAFAQAPTGQPVSSSLDMIATNGAGVKKHFSYQGDRMPQLVINPNQAVPVTLQFPIDKAGTPVAVAPLDGGEVNGSQTTVFPTGKFLFTFRGSAPGLYRLVVQLPAEQYRLEFYVIDPNHPRR